MGQFGSPQPFTRVNVDKGQLLSSGYKDDDGCYVLLCNHAICVKIFNRTGSWVETLVG